MSLLNRREQLAAMEPQLSPEESLLGGFDPAEYLRLIKARWPIILVVCLVAMGLGLTHYLMTPKLYRASSIIRIEQRSMSPISTDRNPWLEAWASVKYYPTQYRLLKSRGLAERVVERLKLLEDPAFNRDAARYAEARERGAPLPEGTAAASARIADRLASGLGIDPIGGTELVTLHFVSSDPQQAARIANAWAETFIEWDIETRSESVGKASRFLAQEIRSLREEIAAKEQELQTLGRSIDVISLDPESPGTSLAEQRLTDLNASYTGAIAQRLELATRYRYRQAAPDEALVEETPGSSINRLRSEKLELEREYDTKLQTYKPDWPAMVELKAKIVEAESQLQRVIRDEADKIRKRAFSEYEAALRREAALQQEIQKVRDAALSQNPATAGYHSVQTELLIRKDLLDRLLRQLTETGVSASVFSSHESNISIVEQALVPGAPFRPSLKNDLLMGFSAGLVLGIGLVLLLHFLDRTIKSPEELERILGLPVLAVVHDLNRGRYSIYQRYGYGYGYGARSKKRRRKAAADGEAAAGDGEGVSVELVPALQPRLAISEAYRSLRTALLLSSAEQLRVITITSAEAGEGKTATAVNLTVVMSQLGRKVLLIDADLRKPRLHRVLGVSNRVGLVSYLTGNAAIDEIFQSVPQSTLHFCPSGPHPPNPSELLSSERMVELLEIARNRYDLVILDSPPVLAVTDSIVASSLSDGAVLCFRANKVLREDVKSCRDRLFLADVKILGVILNRYRPTRGGYYSRRYHYYETYAETVDEPADSAA